MRDWWLVLKWSWRHRKWLNADERFIAKTDPVLWWRL